VYSAYDDARLSPPARGTGRIPSHLDVQSVPDLGISVHIVSAILIFVLSDTEADQEL
jgi:hypothetical protein